MRPTNGRREKTRFIIVDAQSVKNTDTAAEKGYDGGKNIAGIKRHSGVDTQGLAPGIAVTPANMTDRAGAISLVEQAQDELSEVTNILADGGYAGKPFAETMQDVLGATVEVGKRNERHSFVVIPHRWVVERSYGWREKCRRRWKNRERNLTTSLHMMVLAFLSLLLKRF